MDNFKDILLIKGIYYKAKVFNNLSNNFSALANTLKNLKNTSLLSNKVIKDLN